MRQKLFVFVLFLFLLPTAHLQASESLEKKKITGILISNTRAIICYSPAGQNLDGCTHSGAKNCAILPLDNPNARSMLSMFQLLFSMGKYNTKIFVNGCVDNGPKTSPRILTVHGLN